MSDPSDWMSAPAVLKERPQGLEKTHPRCLRYKADQIKAESSVVKYHLLFFCLKRSAPQVKRSLRLSGRSSNAALIGHLLIGYFFNDYAIRRTTILN